MRRDWFAGTAAAKKKKRKKNLKSFLKKIWIKWIVSLCDEMAVARHFGDTWSWQTRGIADNTRMFLSTFQAWVASTRDSQRYLKKNVPRRTWTIRQEA